MSTTEGGGDIVRDGLVLYLDAANPKSYLSGSTTWVDLSRGGNNGSLINGPTFNLANGGSIVFDGTNQNITTNPIVYPNKTNFTLNSVWKFSTSKANALFSSGGPGTSSNDVLFAYDPGLLGVGGLIFQVNNGSDGSAYTTRPYVSNTWINTCVVFDGTQTGNQNRLKVYLNGVLENLTYSYTVPSSTSSSNWPSYFGRYISFPGWDLLGNIAFVQIYNRSLNENEILQNFNLTKSRFGI